MADGGDAMTAEAGANPGGIIGLESLLFSDLKDFIFIWGQSFYTRITEQKKWEIDDCFMELFDIKFTLQLYLQQFYYSVVHLYWNVCTIVFCNEKNIAIKVSNHFFFTFIYEINAT